MHNQKIEENKSKSREKDYILKQMSMDDSFRRNQKREELDNKQNLIINFLNEKNLINEEKRFIDNNYNSRYNYYSQQIDEMMHKRPMDKTTLNNIQYMVCDNPDIAGLVHNSEVNYK